MKHKNLHIHYSENSDQVFIVDHGAKPMLAFERHEEALRAGSRWGLRGCVPDHATPLSIFERILKRFGKRVLLAKGQREVTSEHGTVRITVEHFV